MASCTKGPFLKHGRLLDRILFLFGCELVGLLLQERSNGRSVVYKTSLLYSLLRSSASKRSLSSFNYLSLLSEELQKYMARRTKIHNTRQALLVLTCLLPALFSYSDFNMFFSWGGGSRKKWKRNLPGPAQVNLWNIFVLFLKNHGSCI